MPRIRHKFWFGIAAAFGAYAVNKYLPNLPDWTAVVLAVAAIVLYALGLLDWSRKFAAIAQNNRRKETLKLRVILVGLFIVASGATLVIVLDVLPKPALNTEDLARLERYRRFYENSDAPYKTTLIEMTNGELKTRGTNLYTRIKAMNAHYSETARNRQARRARNEIDDVESGRLWLEEMAQAGEEFDENYRTEARMVLLELRNRIPYEARKHIVGLPSINPADKRAGKVSLYDIFPSEFAVGFSDLLAREIEELVKLLPDD